MTLKVSTQPMRTGIFGGTFDPVHVAHLVLAEQTREQARLDRVFFIPAARPPHKLDKSITPFHHRVEMLELAIAGYPVFQINQMEKDRPGPSYTADTLRALHEQSPGDELFLLIGSDSVFDLPGWYQPEVIARLATLLIFPRPGTEHAEPPASFPWQRINTPLLDIASRDLRARLTAGRSIRYLVPRAVESYIAAHQLYRG